MGIKKILFPTNFEELSLPTVKSLLSLTEAGLKEIVFLFVIDRNEVGFNLLTGFDKDYATTLSEQANLRFKSWEQDLKRTCENITCTHVVEIGSPEGKILEVAAREKVDMIVAGRRRPIRVGEVYLSGTTMGVLRRTSRPVMVYRQSAEQGIDNKFESVLLTTDFSKSADRSFEYVKSLYGATKVVDIVHVLLKKRFKRHSSEEMQEFKEKCHNRMNEMAEELREIGFTVYTHLLAGDAIQETLLTSSDYNSTCIIMGTTGRSGFKEVWLGSVSHRMVERSNVSVILVPEKEQSDYD